MRKELEHYERNKAVRDGWTMRQIHYAHFYKKEQSERFLDWTERKKLWHLCIKYDWEYPLKADRPRKFLAVLSAK